MTTGSSVDGGTQPCLRHISATLERDVVFKIIKCSTGGFGIFLCSVHTTLKFRTSLDLLLNTFAELLKLFKATFDDRPVNQFVLTLR
jgi:hypothetical protein